MPKKRHALFLGLAFALGAASTSLFPAAPGVIQLDPEEELVLAAANWTHYGCIQLGNDCLDVFLDNKGNLWVCQECFTTQNPGPGKCRKLTALEIANALWCA